MSSKANVWSTYADHLGEVYILHLERKFPTGPAQHYVGFAPYYRNKSTLEERLAKHAAGQGAKMLAAAVRYGIPWTLALVIPANQLLETAIKSLKHTSRACPICVLASHDWNTLRMGDWLTGRMLWMQQYNLQIERDQFNAMMRDWAERAMMYLGGQHG